jgi:hypothetical protein
MRFREAPPGATVDEAVWAGRRIGPLVVASLAWALPSRASPESDGHALIRPIRVALSESLPQECAGTTPLFERVVARTDRIRRVMTDADADADAFVRVVVRREGDRLLGELTVEEGAGRTARSVSASTCEAVITAFAVMVVVALDPHAELAPPRLPAPPEERAVAPAGPRTTTLPPENDVGPAIGRSAGPSTPPPTNDVGPAIGLSGGVGLSLQGYEGGVFERAAMLELSIGTAFYPRVRAAVARSEHVAVATPSDRVDLVWTTGRASLCGGPGWLHRHHISLCASTAIGALDAAVARPGGPARSLLWITAGPTAVLDIELGWRLGLEIEAGVSIPALRDRFFFEPGRVL